MSDYKKKIALLSNYSWVYTSSQIAKKYFPKDDIILITANTEGVAEKHNFGMDVTQIKNFKLKEFFSYVRQISSFRRMRFETVIIDYSFSLNTILLLTFLKFKKIFIIDLNNKKILRMIKKLDFLRIFMKKIPYFINKVLIILSMKFRMGIGLGLPSELFIETTSACNLKCKGCPTGLGQLNRPPMSIPPDLFRNIIGNNKIIFRYLDIVYPFLYGEPLLNKNIFEYLQRLRKTTYPYTRIELHTNGNIANSRDVARKLLETEIDLVSISLDGTDKRSYENFRKGGDFDLVCEFVRNLTMAKKEMGLLRPEIAVQMILTKYSEDKTEEFKKLKDSLGADRYLFKGFFYEFTHLSEKKADQIAPSKKELVLTKEKKKEIIDKKNNLCGWPYRSFTIMCNGKVTPCCIDSNASLLNGLNIYNSTIKMIWNSAKFRRFRKDMLCGKIKICNKCFFS